MNLIELYDILSIPNEGNEKTFNALPIPNYPDCRIGIDFQGNPVLLLSVINPVRDISSKNFRLKHLQLTQNLECKISENGKTTFQTFTVLTFTNADRLLQEYFLRVSESLIKLFQKRPAQEKVVEAINRFIEVFRLLGDIPRNTIHGLWSELFLIENSIDPKILLNYWHNIPEERFDFNAGAEKVEVKSNSNFERIHTFSAEQLNPSSNSQAIIASIFIKQSSSGLSIQQLVDNICNKITEDIELTNKLLCMVSQSLGNSLEQSIHIKFDYTIAKESLKYYRHQDIHKIEKVNIPNEVFEVRYNSDLGEVKPTHLSEVTIDGILFKALR
jgi:Putative  PD-(D/E)XK family member, (DUF4420)